ncbi:hypothetical protein H0H87_004789 [Tephrocybe sp. NHM501043]|nr:hypothetical protein H0H87_004789 [Tephrocybe sp. NHM501043]
MSTTPSSAVRRPKQQVYVDVPRSPYPTASAFSHKPAPVPALTSLTLKENTPLRPSNGGTTRPVDEFQTLKRKTSDLELTSFKATNAKKQKLAEPLAEQQLAQPDVHGRLPLLNDFVYCHQCSQKRDVAASVHCNSTKIVKGIKKQCRIKFCFPCLKNRYGEDVVEIKAHGINGVYNFKTTSVEMPKPEIVVSRSPQPAKKTVEVFITTFPPKGAFSKKAAKAQSDSRKSRPKVSTGTKLKVDAKPKQQTLQQMIPQVLPALKWTQVPTNLDLHEAESRFQIREFVLRFASVMEPPIPRNQLAELDDLGCGSNDEEIAPWVSEACVRSIILGLLGMLASSKGETQKACNNHSFLLKSATRDIRATGNNLTKMWPILAKLRDALSGYAQVTYPDPLPLPASATIYATRTTCSAGDSNGGRPNVTIGRSAQMIPVVEALIEAAIESPVAHGEIDDGVGDCKELVREVQKAVREENERWDAERKILEADKEKEKEKEASEKQVKEKLKSKTALEVLLTVVLWNLCTEAIQIKLKREVHKARLRDLDHALRLLTAGFAPRFAPLGADTSGRTFWTASPGVGERKAALDFIASASKKAKAKAFTLDNDTSTKWSWFLAVWGKKIPTAVAAPATENDKDEDVERWWAFSEPIEIRKLADWIRIDAGINPYDELDGNKPLALLVKGLSDYAALLDWRLKEDKYEAA